VCTWKIRGRQCASLSVRGKDTDEDEDEEMKAGGTRQQAEKARHKRSKDAAEVNKDKERPPSAKS